MKDNEFIYGSFLLVLVNLIVGIIDFIYDVMLSKFIGAEGMGLFQMVMSILMVFLVVSTGGIPTAVSKMVAEENSKKNNFAIKKILRLAILLTLILSTIFSIVLIFFSKTITSRMFNNEDMLFSIYLLIPVVLIISISSILRGYYYGLKMIMIPSVSQIIEHIARFVIILGFLYYVYPIKPIYGVFIAICGIIVGEVFDLIWLIFMKIRMDKNTQYIPTKINSLSILNQIIYISIPIGISSLLNVILRFAKTILIPNKLMAAGYENSEAIATFGRITGMATPLIMLPFIVTSALVVNLIPNLSERMASKNYTGLKNDVIISIKITLLFSIPLTGLYVFFSQPLGTFLYNDLEVGRFIHIMGYGTICLALQNTFSGILHGLNKQLNATINRLVGMIIQLLAIYYLVGNPKFGINGFFAGFLLSGIVICIFDLISLRRIFKLNVEYKDLILKPIIATTVMITTMNIYLNFFLHPHISDVFSFAFSIIIGVISYIFILYIM